MRSRWRLRSPFDATGVVTLLNQVPISFALLHRAVAMIVLAIAVVHRHGAAAAPLAN